jgi:hypothetical protein
LEQSDKIPDRAVHARRARCHRSLMVRPEKTH